MPDPKVRTQIYLERESYEWLKARAAADKVSIGQQIREAVAEYVVKAAADEETPFLADDDPIWDLIGSGSSGLGDLSINHDHYLYGAPKREESE